jgi:hypothetical protein
VASAGSASSAGLAGSAGALDFAVFLCFCCLAAGLVQLRFNQLRRYIICGDLINCGGTLFAAIRTIAAVHHLW